MNLSDVVTDALVEHDLDLTRVEAGAVRDGLTALKTLEDATVQILKDIEPTTPTRMGDQRNRMDKALEAIGKGADKIYGSIQRQQGKHGRDLVETEDKAVRKIVNAAVGAVLLRKGITASGADALIDQLLIQGIAWKERWRRQRDGFKGLVRETLNPALRNKKHLDQMIRLLRGTRPFRLKDGVFWKTRSGLETFLRTSHHALVQSSRMATYRVNDSVIRGVQAQAVLDSRTTMLCRTRNGMAWLLDGTAFPGAYTGEWLGTPPWHWYCRTTLNPIFRTLRALQRAVDDPRLNRVLADRNQQIPFDGKPAETISLEAWMAKRPPELQQQYFGKGKWELWQKGLIKPADLFDQSGREYTLTELKAKLGLD